MNGSNWVVAIVAGAITVAVLLIAMASLYAKVDVTGLVIAATIGLGVVVLMLSRFGERRIHSRDLPTQQLGTTLDRPTTTSQPFLVAIGVVCYALALVGWVSGGLPLDGRWGWLIKFFHQWLGAMGPGLLFAIAGTVLVYIGTRRPRN